MHRAAAHPPVAPVEKLAENRADPVQRGGLCFVVRTGNREAMDDIGDLETNMLGPVLADRACGDCTACCTVLTVASPDFAKPAGVPCVHLRG